MPKGLCYSEPKLLLNQTIKEMPLCLTLFRFVKQHYKTLVFLLFLIYFGMKTNYRYFLFSFSILQKRKEICLFRWYASSSKDVIKHKTIDVIIPR
jgi:hypothetical protein